MEQKMQELKEIFRVGEKYSLYYIDEMMAMSHCQRITVKHFVRSKDKDWDDVIVFVLKGKRKERCLRLESRSYQSAPMLPYKGGIFKGWEQPVCTDTEQCSGVMRGNACYNFIGTPETIKTWIENNQLNPYFEKASVVAVDPDMTTVCGDSAESVVFPDEVEPGRHAVIDRLLMAAS